MKSVQNNRGLQEQGGLSIVEFMVAMLLGTILIGGAITIYLASQRSYVESERSMQMSEGARFALMLITDSLRHAGFMGGIQGADIENDAGLGAVTGACTGDGDAYDLTNYIAAVKADSSGDAYGCIDDAVPDSDVLVVKGFLPDPLYDEDPNDPAAVLDGDIEWPNETENDKTYVIANVERGLLIDGAESLASQPDVSQGEPYAGALAWPYQFQIFYLREPPLRANGDRGVPKLARKVLVYDGTNMVIETQDLVEGIERMRFRFGWDDDEDGFIDTYGGLEDVETANAWDTVAFVEAFILARSESEDVNYENAKTYQLGDETFDPNDPAFDENFVRLLVSNAVTLRNPSLYLLGGS
ncbi:MAG: PilW family protein [Gammaproteobacteria bacterium]|jgi:type IV pilus assembly protein PilW|nr:PilW family protein [Gammaproteobacteria bacterium]